MHLKILLPSSLFLDQPDVQRIHLDALNGSNGFLPNRLDCAASLTPGIMMFETNNGKRHYVAHDEGVMVKTGRSVTISSRNAVGGADLGQLHGELEKLLLSRDQKEIDTRVTIARLESGIIREFERFQRRQ